MSHAQRVSAVNCEPLAKPRHDGEVLEIRDTKLQQNARSPGECPGSSLSCFPIPLSSFQPRVLLLDHALIQLLEEQRRLAPRLPRREGAGLPGADGTAVIVGQSRVTAGLFLILDHLLRPKELPLGAQVLVQLLRRVRQD